MRMQGTPHRGACGATALNILAIGHVHRFRSLTSNMNEFTFHMAKEFNSKTPNNGEVLYLSWAGRRDMVVSVLSAQWGHYLGTLDVSQ